MTDALGTKQKLKRGRECVGDKEAEAGAGFIVDVVYNGPAENGRKE